MGHKSYCTSEVETRSAKRTSQKSHWDCSNENVGEELYEELYMEAEGRLRN